MPPAFVPCTNNGGRMSDTTTSPSSHFPSSPLIVQPSLLRTHHNPMPSSPTNPEHQTPLPCSRRRSQSTALRIGPGNNPERPGIREDHAPPMHSERWQSHAYRAPKRRCSSVRHPFSHSGRRRGDFPVLHTQHTAPRLMIHCLPSFGDKRMVLENRRRLGSADVIEGPP